MDPERAPAFKTWQLGCGQGGVVSVIVPTFNRESLIIETLDSVSRQSYRPLEVIVVDDGSTDGTCTAVERWSRSLGSVSGLSVSVIKLDNGGASRARNAGALKSSGEFIQFLDSDDLLSPEKIASQVVALRKDPTASFAFGPVKSLVAPQRTVYGHGPITVERAVFKQLVSPTFTTNGPLLRRTALERAGPWDESMPYMQDWEFHTRCSLRGLRPVFVPKGLSFYRDGSAMDGQRERVSSGRRPANPLLWFDVNRRRLDSAWRETDRKAPFRHRMSLGLVLRHNIAVASLVAWGFSGSVREFQSHGVCYVDSRMAKAVQCLATLLCGALPPRIFSYILLAGNRSYWIGNALRTRVMRYLSPAGNG